MAWHHQIMSPTTARADLAAYNEAMRLSTAEVSERLMSMLGAKLVAYLGSVRETRAVRQWAAGEREPSADVVRRLRTALQVAGLLRDKDSAEVVQVWFQGMNPQLGDVAPARLLREGDLDDVAPQVLAAARAFAAEG